MVELFKKEKGLLIQNATSDYLAKTATNKTLKTQEVDRSCVQRTFQYFTQAGLTSVDEIKIKHVQDMIDSLIADQYSLSSIRNAVTAVKKVFVWLIEIQEAELKNPVLINKLRFSEGSVVRDRLLLEEELCALQKALYSHHPVSSSATRLQPSETP